MSKIIPHLWFDTQAKEAAEFYTSVLPNSKIKNSTVLDGTPSGSVDMLSIELAGQEFALISAGPYFKFTPAVSFLITCNSKDEVDTLWAKFSEGGMVMMELQAYPFSERYGWTQDKFGLSWQIMYMENCENIQKITPTFMFVGDVCGKTEEALNFYSTVFHNSKIGNIMRYGPGEDPDKEGTVKFAGFTLEDLSFAAMDSAHKHNFTFNEAISFIVHCDNQEEIDYYWEKLSAVPEAELCGWLKDKYGVSWQIVPTAMNEIFQSQDKDKIARVTASFLKMKKFNLAELQQAADGI